MNYFRCSFIKGSGGSGSSLIVTCDSEFAGATIVCTKGTTTYRKVCPATSPYEVSFENLEEGIWTISSTVNGKTYSATIEITDFETYLVYGFDWRRWVTLGGLDLTDYRNLDDVFDNEEAVRRLMTVHNSADYLTDAVTEDVDVIDEFCANDIAMKWIGLRDYVCDGLTAINGVWAKFLASDYWERILKDHVPTMKSNTTPYGTAGASSESSTAANKAWAIFDGNDSTYASKSAQGTGNARIYYKFTNPIKVRKFYYLLNSVTNRPFKIQYSDDGTTWNDAYNGTILSTDRIEDDINDVGYHLYWGVYVMNSTNWSNYGITLQFYGRSLNVSVPVMTSNTAPYGEVSATTAANGVPAYYAFDNNASTHWGASSTTNQRVAYKFTRPVVITEITIRPDYSSGAAASYKYGRVKNFKVQGSNNGTNWTDIYSGQCSTPSVDMTYTFDFSNTTSYLYYCVLVIDVWTGNTACGIVDLNFYGVDYSEREFAEGSTMKYLYDHGVELESFGDPILQNANSTASKDNDRLFVQVNGKTGGSAYSTENTINFSNYNLLRIVVGDELYSSSSVQQPISIGVSLYRAYDSSVSQISKFGPSTGDNPNTPSLDISSVTDNAYAFVGTRNNSSNSYIYNGSIKEFWLE